MKPGFPYPYQPYVHSRHVRRIALFCLVGIPCFCLGVVFDREAERHGNGSIARPPEPSSSGSTASSLPAPGPEAVRRERFRSLSAFLEQGDYLSLEIALRDLAQRNPDWALAWAAGNRPPANTAAERIVLAVIVRTDPDKAFSWSKANLPDFLLGEDFIRACTDRHDIGRALEGLQLASSAGYGYDTLGRNCSPGDRSALLHAIGALDGGTRMSILQGMLVSMADDDPKGAFASIDTLAASLGLPESVEGYDRGTLVRGIVSSWINAGNVSKAIEYLKDAPISRDYARSYADVARGLARTDPDNAMEWIQRAADASSTNPMARDMMTLSPMLALLNNNRPDLAAQVALYASTPQRVEVRLKEPILKWWVKDPDAAVGFITTAPGLSEATRQTLRALLPSPTP